MPDSLGTTFFNSQANFNVLPICSVENHQVTTTNIRNEYSYEHAHENYSRPFLFHVAYTTNADPIM